MTLKENKVGHGLSLNTIYNMDCIEGMKLIPDGSIDCIITDPPYGTTACKRDTIIPFDLMREQLKRIIKPNGAIVLFGSEPFSSSLRMSNIKMYKYDWIWNKTRGSNFANVKYQPMKKTENIMVFCKKTNNYYPIMEEGEKYNTRHNSKRKDTGIYGNTLINRGDEKKVVSNRFPSNVIKVGNMRQQSVVHPTQKPVALIEYLIKTYSLEDDIILDFTSGSGTTGIAAQNTNRKFIMIEKDKNYYDISLKRLQENQERLDKLSKKDII